MSGPLGALMMVVTRGLHDALALAELAVRVPSRASQAMLTGIYQLPPDRVARARRTGSIAATLLAVVSAAVVVGLVTASLTARGRRGGPGSPTRASAQAARRGCGVHGAAPAGGERAGAAHGRELALRADLEAVDEIWIVIVEVLLAESRDDLLDPRVRAH